MKDVTNVLVVLFLIVGAGLVYAGKGVCTSPETTVEVDTEASYYPSGTPQRIETSTTYFYGDMYCEGDEGECTTSWNSSAPAGRVDTQWWTYRDDSDDSNILLDSGEDSTDIYGRTVC